MVQMNLLEGRNRDVDIGNKYMDTKEEKREVG